MNIELNVLNDGGLMMVSDTPLPDLVKRVEFYREQQLFMLVYDRDEDSDLMHFEIPANMVQPIERTPDLIIYTLYAGEKPLGYKVPLIKVGNIC